jgi:LysR family hydrogen peroxide-inducible transcriptional activator
MITLRQLRYLQALARHQHFGRAAEDCAVSQPALSMQIKELERDLRVVLVERRPSDVKLTDVGLEVAERAGRILSDAHDLVDFARHRGRVLTGPLRFGIIPTLAPYVLPRVLPALQSRHPDLHLNVYETQTTALLAELRRATVDVIMLALPVDDPDIETMRLFDDRFLLAVPTNDPLPSNARAVAADIDQRRLILLEEGHCLRDQALAFCATARSQGAASLGATSLATVMQLVANKYGVTLVPEIAAEAEVRDDRVRLIRFARPEPGRTIGLAWRKTSPRKLDFVALGQIVRRTLGKTGRGEAAPAIAMAVEPGT